MTSPTYNPLSYEALHAQAAIAAMSALLTHDGRRREEPLRGQAAETAAQADAFADELLRRLQKIVS